MRALIVEDEQYAAEQLIAMLQEYASDIEILCVIDTIQEAVRYLKTSSPPDIIFLDIHISDGISMEIFREVQVDIPVILTTAYDGYSLQAFEINSIDYLLKPIKKEDLDKALQKYQRLEGKRSIMLEETISVISHIFKKPGYKKYFLLPFKDHMIPIAAADFSYFEARHGLVRGVSLEGKIFLMEDNLEQLTECLDPSQFYRANRQFLVNRKAIQIVEFYFNGRLLLKTAPANEENILVSKAKATEFKSWMSTS